MNNRGKGRSKTVLVTGSSGGIGRAISLRFAEEGWNVLCHYRSSDKKALELKKNINDLGADCRILKVDLSSKSELKNFVKEIRKIGIDSLINNAASHVKSAHYSELTADILEDTFMINTFAPMLLASAVFERMKKRQFGRIVNISSIAAKYGGSEFSMHYGASKRALEGLTKTLAREGAPHNVLVNTIRPGVIDTDFYKKFPKDMKKRIAMIPMKRMGRPEDIAEMAYYFGSGKNSFITNQTITIAGGE